MYEPIFKITYQQNRWKYKYYEITVAALNLHYFLLYVQSILMKLCNIFELSTNKANWLPRNEHLFCTQYYKCFYIFLFYRGLKISTLWSILHAICIAESCSARIGVSAPTTTVLKDSKVQCAALNCGRKWSRYQEENSGISQYVRRQRLLYLATSCQSDFQSTTLSYCRHWFNRQTVRFHVENNSMKEFISRNQKQTIWFSHCT